MAGCALRHTCSDMPYRALIAGVGRMRQRIRREVPVVRVLVVEDERVLADAIATGLRREAMAVDVAYDGAGALERTGYIDYDVIVLDRDLPKVHGDEVCRRLVAERTASRILMLTASGDVDDKVEGLGLGA